jgi:hypothetical protein
MEMENKPTAKHRSLQIHSLGRTELVAKKERSEIISSIELKE